MKIFSLQTKKHLVGWSAVCTIMLQFVISIFFSRVETCSQQNIFSFISENCKTYGWPWRYSIFKTAGMLYDLFFWLL